MKRLILGVLVLGFWGSAVLGFAQAATSQAPRDATAPAPAGKGVIAGTLVAADTGRPIRMARVTASGGDIRATKTAVTDDQGRFSLTELPPGPFTITASKPGFLDVVHGQKRPGSGRPGTPIQLAAGQKLDRLTLTMPRGGVITGTVLDDVGDVSFGTPVQALRYVMRTGVRTLQVVRSATTDDRGIYRIPALPPGEYLVMAMPRAALGAGDEMKMRAELVMVEAAKAGTAGAAAAEQAVADVRAMLARGPDGEEPLTGYTTVFHPSAMQASGASAVTLDIAEERANVDVRLQLVPLAKISGMVTSEGPLAGRVQVSLIDVSDTVGGSSSRATGATPDGRFSFSGIPPGTYMVTARAQVAPPAAAADQERAAVSADVTFVRSVDGVVAKETRAMETLWATAEVSVAGGSVPMTALNLQRGMTVSGSVAFDGLTGAPVDFAKLRVTLAPAAETAARGEGVVRDVAVNADGRFVIRGVVPGKYRVVPSSGVPQGFLIESSVFGGRDVLDVPLEVKPGEDVAGGVLTFSTRAAELTGALTDLAGKPAPDYTLVLFAAENRFWLPQSRRIQAARPTSDGRFSFRGLPPGDYRLIAVEDVEPGQWFDPAFLKELVAGSMPVSLGKGEKRTQDVRIGR